MSDHPLLPAASAGSTVVVRPYALDAVLWPDHQAFSLQERLLIVGLRGSEAHGTYQPAASGGMDDRDVTAVFRAPRQFYLGMPRATGWEHAESITGEWDVVCYEVRKFVGLLARQNPNVLSLLWLEPQHYLFLSPLGRRLVEARRLFRVRQSAYDAFTGYARAQLQKMTGHGAYRGYMGAKRKALVDQCGYDPKNAAHLVRLLHMGYEYLLSGMLNVARTWDRQMLIEIKTGSWPLAAVQSHAAAWTQRCQDAYPESVLPERLDVAAIDALLLDVFAEME